MSTAREVLATKFKAADNLIAQLERHAEKLSVAVKSQELAQERGRAPDPQPILEAIAATPDVFWPSLLSEDLPPQTGEESVALTKAQSEFQKVMKVVDAITEGKFDASQLMSHALDATAHHLDLVTMATGALKQLRDRYANGLNVGSALSTPTGGDGPVLPRTFRWKGKTIDVQPKVCELLNFLFAHPSSLVADIESSVWGDKSENDNRLKNAIKKANKALQEAGCNGVVSREKDRVALKIQGVFRTDESVL